MSISTSTQNNLNTRNQSINTNKKIHLGRNLLVSAAIMPLCEIGVYLDSYHPKRTGKISFKQSIKNHIDDYYNMWKRTISELLKNSKFAEKFNKMDNTKLFIASRITSLLFMTSFLSLIEYKKNNKKIST